MLQTILLVVHIFSAIAIIGLVLVQQGKGADAGAAFGGGGASGSVFGSKGSASFLTKLTATFAVVFFAVSIVLAYQARTMTRSVDSVVEGAVIPAPASQDAVPEVSEAVKEGAAQSSGIPEIAETATDAPESAEVPAVKE